MGMSQQMTDEKKLEIANRILTEEAATWPRRRAQIDRVSALDHAPDCKESQRGGPDARCEYHRHGGSIGRLCDHDRYATPPREVYEREERARHEWSA